MYCEIFFVTHSQGYRTYIGFASEPCDVHYICAEFLVTMDKERVYASFSEDNIISQSISSYFVIHRHGLHMMWYLS